MGWGRIGSWLGAAAMVAGVLGASISPGQAAASLVVRGGGVLTVEAVGLDLDQGGWSSGTRALAWVLRDATGIRTGVVPSTSNAAPDASPMLIADPRTGAPVLIWSRWDGQAMKLAWSRFGARSWGPVHDITFGPGNDRSPAVGVSQAGAYLFFWRDDTQAMYAPIDLGTGRLIAAPRELTTAPPSASSPGPAPDAGTDVPIIISTCGGASSQLCIGGQPVPPDDGQTPLPSDDRPTLDLLDGGNDVPITITTTSSANTLSVASHPGCGTMVVDLSGDSAHPHVVVAFSGAGRTRALARLRAAAGISPADASAASTSYFLRSVCH